MKTPRKAIAVLAIAIPAAAWGGCNDPKSDNGGTTSEPGTPTVETSPAPAGTTGGSSLGDPGPTGPGTPNGSSDGSGSSRPGY